MKKGKSLSKKDYEALASFRRALRKFLHFAEESARTAGLTAQQHQLLLAIKGQSGRDWASVSELAHALLLSHHAAVGLVDRCEKASLVRRESDLIDRRQVRVSLTESGENVLASLSERNRDELRALRQALDLSFLESVTQAQEEAQTK